MSTPSSQPRPRQTTLAAGMVIAGSVLIVLTAWEVVGGIRSVQSREEIERFLATGPGGDLGLDVETAISILRGIVTVSAVCAAAAAVLGVFALRRHRGARVGLAVLAVPMFLAGLATGGFLSSLVVVASVMLWISPSREWFAGRPVPQPVDRRRPDRDRPRDDVDAWGVPRPPQPGPGERPADSPVRATVPADVPPDARPTQPGAQPGAQPPPSSRAFGAPAPGAPAHPYQPVPGLEPRRPAARPGAVMAAAVVTWVVSGIVLLVSLVTAIAMLGAGDLLLDEMERQQPGLVDDSGVSREALSASVVVMGFVLSAAAASAMVLAVLVLRRRSAARTALLVMSLVTAVLGILTSLATFAAVLPAFGAILVAALLRRPETRAWFADPRR